MRNYEVDHFPPLKQAFTFFIVFLIILLGGVYSYKVCEHRAQVAAAKQAEIQNRLPIVIRP